MPGAPYVAVLTQMNSHRAARFDSFGKVIPEMDAVVHDIVLADFARPSWRRVPCAIAAFSDFILTGTAFRYFRVNWRYGLFFAYPVTLLLAFVALSIYAASFLPGLGLLLWNRPLILPLAILRLLDRRPAEAAALFIRPNPAT